ncbi:MAG TPA: hypothetical protein VKG38_17485 [Solirubrobacteraceae bacterium]|nr:hypothetical protein [Solirubrobacteraceae bacterium]
MHGESSGTPAGVGSAAEAAVLALLLSEGRRPWTVGELALELGDELDAVDALAALQGAGLAHGWGDFVIASRAAAHAERLLRC